MNFMLVIFILFCKL